MQCCCCVVTSTGTRNFCPAKGGWNSVDGYDGVNTTILVPNCYFLQSHLDAVLSDLNDNKYGGIVDTYSIPGMQIDWRPTDPVYGCLKELETVTATRSSTVATTGKREASAFPTPTTNNVGSGGCIFNGGNLTGIICGNNTNAQIPQNIVGTVRINYTLFVSCIILVLVSVMANADIAGGCIVNGGNQSGGNCNGNTVNQTPLKSAGFSNIQLPVLQLTVIMSFITCIGLVMGAACPIQIALVRA